MNVYERLAGKPEKRGPPGRPRAFKKIVMLKNCE
jgi:hypothetical protein